MNNEKMNIIREICSTESVGCRSLNKVGLVLELMEAVGMDTNGVIIHEVPVDWDNQVLAVFEVGGNWYEFAAGISADGSGKYFEEVRRWSEGGDGELVPLNIFAACEKAEKALSDAYISAEVWDEDGLVVVNIHWGDWKHSHLRADYILNKCGFESVGETVTKEDGSDCYSATHYYKWR